MDSGLFTLDLSAISTTRLTALTSNGFVKVSGGNGTLSVDGNTYLTTASAASTYLTQANAATTYPNVTLAGTPTYITISGQVITRGLITLTSDVTGLLPYANMVNASAASVLVGRGSAGGAGVLQEITLGASLSMSSQVLNTIQAITTASSPTFAGLTLTSGYVASITGTANQVVASAANGAITLSLPQAIATTSTVQFGKVGIGAAAGNYALNLAITSGTAGSTVFIQDATATTGSTGFIIKAGAVANTSGEFQVQDASANKLLSVRTIGAAGGGFIIGNYDTSYGGLWSAGVTPSSSNYCLVASANATSLNAPSGKVITFQINDAAAVLVMNSALLGWGGVTSASPALKRSSAILQCRLADDSAYAKLQAFNIILSNLPTSASGLTTGELWNNSGVVNVA